MRFEVDRPSSSNILKERIAIEAEEGNMNGLRKLVKKMKTSQKDAFKKEYGNLLSLLEVEVQTSAITILAQYYDPPLRCFTFRDFQLVPTVEEFEQILNIPLEGKTPYNYLGQYIPVLQLSRIMKVHPMKLESKFTIKGKVRGLPQGYLKGYLHRLAEEENWETFMDVLALLLYGIMLFPNVKNFVDYAAMNAFVGYKERCENPVTAILAKVYGTLNRCYELKGGKMLCCLPVLYMWFISRVSEDALNTTCPMDELLQCKPNVKGANEWAQLCASLNKEQIKWCFPWQHRSHIIYHCGRYPNVPLMGIRCCINYNPVLAQRQFGRPMRGSPTPASLAILQIYYEEGTFVEVLHQVRNAWGNIIRAEMDPRPWTIDEGIPYSHWIAERVRTVKLPFELTSPNLDYGKQFHKAESEEVKLLKAEFEQMKLENIKLTNNLQSLQHDYENLKQEGVENSEAYEELLIRQKQELVAANIELTLKDREYGIIEISERVTKQLCDQSQRDKQKVLEELHKMHIRMDDAEQQANAAVTKLKKERWHRAESEKKHQELMNQMKEYIVEQELVTEHWRRSFSQLASLANEAIKDVPKLLADAESALPIFNPPEKVETFLNYCKKLIREMKNVMAEAHDS
ncbi:uncharacterized protein HKW66_Vig0028770 [Vigna angularis]|uniref:DUF7745 domain-containing protein n=1 Tax=Phaseolus angularis TaxID=3914 RepID=A0A8T0LDG8_PHAAN|nr:uncharacterized protein HKW66_Vig0028770 [Vigna angularis]